MDKIERLRIEGTIIERLPPPVINRPSLPQLAIPRPVIDVPRPRIDYPTIQLPLAAPVPKSNPSQNQPQKETSKPQAPTVTPPQPPLAPQRPIPQLVLPKPEIEVVQPTIEIAGTQIDVPQPKEVLQASVTAIIGTSATLATAVVFNQVRKVMGETMAKATKSKFKIKLRTVKPVLHFIEDEIGVSILEYSQEGVKTLATNVKNPEQFLRDTIESDELYEADHKIVIDEPLRHLFSREGAKRFNYFAPSKKMARRLAARFIFG
jgi:hypothetical protein